MISSLELSPKAAVLNLFRLDNRSLGSLTTKTVLDIFLGKCQTTFIFSHLAQITKFSQIPFIFLGNLRVHHIIFPFTSSQVFVYSDHLWHKRRGVYKSIKNSVNKIN